MITGIRITSLVTNRLVLNYKKNSAATTQRTGVFPSKQVVACTHTRMRVYTGVPVLSSTKNTVQHKFRKEWYASLGSVHSRKREYSV